MFRYKQTFIALFLSHYFTIMILYILTVYILSLFCNLIVLFLFNATKSYVSDKMI